MPVNFYSVKTQNDEKMRLLFSWSKGPPTQSITILAQALMSILSIIIMVVTVVMVLFILYMILGYT